MKGQGAAKGSLFSRFRGYVREVIAELRKAVWPTRDETRRLTMLVIVTSLAVGLFLGAVDLGFTELVKLFFGG
ncbi:MAG: preprotein translocase subunit SecE [Chloroflexota bacterium]|nr:preprotein translocase subunit SecE [Chloroflexota bacterium]